jgi:uncharacterized protein
VNTSPHTHSLSDYTVRVLQSPHAVEGEAWNTLLAQQDPQGNLAPFMRHEYLAALHDSGSATTDTGWATHWLTLWQGEELAAACALYGKDHSFGEYVFDHAWAQAYHEHGLPYYPKALVAVPFTPVPGPRLLARTTQERTLLVQALVEWCRTQNLSSLHLLFGNPEDVAACHSAGLMLRHTVQFHWQNQHPQHGTPYANWDAFLQSLSQDKRKKIRQERRKVELAGVQFRWARGADITTADWDFFYQCYARTYYEHGNAPYLSRDFFARMQATLPEHWLVFVAERDTPAGLRPIACSLIALDAHGRTAYGRYWGALERVDCLHFEACYYQPLQWCIAHGVQRFEGGAQGEHKMARALLPVQTTSAHWLAHPAFADAVARYLEREGEGVANYLDHLRSRSPLRA